MTDTRYPPKTAAELPDDLKPYNEHGEKITSTYFGANGDLFTYANPDGALIGPFPIYRESRGAGNAFLSTYAEYRKYFSDFPPDAMEVAVLTVFAKFKPAFGIYSHTQTATKKCGLTLSQVEQLVAGSKPSDLSESCSIAHDAAHHLVNVPGPLPQDLFDACVKAWGRDGTLGLVHFVGNYCYASVLLNFADAGVPEQA